MKKKSQPKPVDDSNAQASPEIKANEDLETIWRPRVIRSQKIRKDWEREYQVERCEKYLLGKQEDNVGNRTVFNLTLATHKTMLPGLYYTDPKFFVRPKPGHNKPVEDKAASVAEAVLEAIGDEDKNLKNAGRLGVTQAFVRVGVLKVVYDPKMEPNPDAGEPVYQTDEAGNPITDPLSIKPKIDPATGQPMLDPQGQPVPDIENVEFLMEKDPKTGETLKEPSEIVTDEPYRYEWVDAARMLFPDEGPDLHKWTWIGEEVISSLEDSKEDGRFKADLRKQLVANATTEDKRGQYKKASDDDKMSEKLKTYVCYDIKKKKYYIWADGQNFDDFLVDDDLPEGIEDHPYSILNLGMPVLGPEPSPWPVPLIKSWLDPQREYNIRHQQITEGAKRGARKGVYDDNTFPDSDEAVKLLQNPEDMVFARVNNVDKAPKILETPPLNADIWKDIPLLQQDWRFITGQTGAKLGQADSALATEAVFAERQSDVRDSDAKSIVDDWLSLGGTKMLQLVKSTLTLGLYVKIRGYTDTELE